MFWIDVKLISTILEILFHQLSSFPGAHLHTIWWNNIYPKFKNAVRIFSKKSTNLIRGFTNIIFRKGFHAFSYIYIYIFLVPIILQAPTRHPPPRDSPIVAPWYHFSTSGAPWGAIFALRGHPGTDYTMNFMNELQLNSFKGSRLCRWPLFLGLHGTSNKHKKSMQKKERKNGGTKQEK